MDTNGDPNQIDYIVPGNDDAMRSIHLIVEAFANAVLEGKAMRKGTDEEEEEEIAEIDLAAYGDEDDAGDEAYLGASTLAKLRDASLFDDEEDDEDEEIDEDDDFDDQDEYDDDFEDDDEETEEDEVDEED